MTTLITGASSGIGEALALASAKRGDTLFLCARNEARLKQVANACEKIFNATSKRTDGVPLDGAKVSWRVVDVCDEVAISEWIREASINAPIDRVFANAGVSTGEETTANVRRTFAVNVGGTLNTVLAAIDANARQIVITSSIAGYGPLKACPSYSATKACLKTWGLALRGALAPRNIKVNVVCPGFVRSRITDKNTCPMPFFMEADRAAEKILRGVDQNRGIIAFPWPMRLATWLLSLLPFRLNELVNSRLPSNGKLATFPID